MAAKILLVGDIYSVHISNLVKQVKSRMPEIQIDIFSTTQSAKPFPENSRCFSNIYACSKHCPLFLYRIPFLSGILRRFVDLRLSFQMIRNHYDLINVHFISLDSVVLYSPFRKITRKVMVSPWGSDIYRVNILAYFFIRTILRKSEFISAPKIKFRADIISKFKLRDKKFIELGFGSEIIDNILRHRNLSLEDAKKAMGLESKYVITCGYNGSPKQNHIKIIDAISNIADKLPYNLIVLLPMTYGGDSSYRKEVEQKLEEKKLQYKIISSFLTDNEMVYLRKCSDVFIHAQPTDAFSGSIQEYILTGTKVINGIWTRYPDLEKNSMPYVLFHNFEELESKLLEVYNSENSPINAHLETFIIKQGWAALGESWKEFYRNVALIDE